MIDFLIVAFVIFLVVQAVNRMKRQPEEAAEASTKECPYCASSIGINSSAVSTRATTRPGR